MTDATTLVARAKARHKVLTCTSCDLRAKCGRPVPFATADEPDYVVLGEAPGRSEDRQGRPMVGQAGRQMRRMLRQAHLQPDSAGWVNVVSCVSGDTTINGPSIRRGFRRTFKGNVLHLVTRSNHRLTVTPNHPILTTRGWAAAGELRPGDHLLTGFPSKQVSGRYPDVERPPSFAEEIFDALAVSGVRERLVGSNMDFHGDGKPSEIQIVRSGRHLTGDDQPFLAQPGLEHPFIPARNDLFVVMVPGSRQECLANGSRVAFDASDSIMSRTYHSGDLVRSHEVESELSRRFPVSDSHASLSQVFGDSDFADTGVTSDTGHSFTDFVSPDPLVQVVGSQGDLPVYNFETTEGWYSANGIIVHNCWPHGTPEQVHRDACESNLDAQLDAIGCDYVVAAGAIALGSLAPDVKLAAVHGCLIRVRDLWVLPTWHPAKVLREPDLRPVVVGALERFAAVLLGADPVDHRMTRCVECGVTADLWDDREIGYCDRHRRLVGEYVKEASRKKKRESRRRKKENIAQHPTLPLEVL